MSRPAPLSDAAHHAITTELVRLCLASSAAPERRELLVSTGSATPAFDRLMQRAHGPLPAPTWSGPGDLGRRSIDAMRRRGKVRHR